MPSIVTVALLVTPLLLDAGILISKVWLLLIFPGLAVKPVLFTFTSAFELPDKETLELPLPEVDTVTVPESELPEPALTVLEAVKLLVSKLARSAPNLTALPFIAKLSVPDVVSSFTFTFKVPEPV